MNEHRVAIGNEKVWTDPHAARAFVERCWQPVDAALQCLGV